MIKALFTSKTGSVTSAAIIIGALSLLSRVFGVVRDNILAGMFGAGDVLDAYTSSFLIPDMLLQLLMLGALSASFIPIFSKYYGSDDEKAWKFTSNILNVFGVAFAIVSIIAFLAAPWLMHLVAPGYAGDKLELAIAMSRVIYVSELFFAVSMVFGSVLQGTKRFFLYALAPIVNNVGIILGAVFFVSFLGPIGLAWGSVLGAAMHALLQTVGVYALGFRYTFGIRFRDPDLRITCVQMIPRVLGLAVNQVNFVVMVAFASLSVAGSATVLKFAYNLNSFPIGIIAMAYAVASFPVMCERMAKKDVPGFVDAFSHAVRQVLLWIIPVTVLFLLLRAQIVRLAFGRGHFDWVATVTTADTLAFFAMSFAAQALVYILVRAFFALEDTKTPFVAGVVGAALNIVLGYFLGTQYGPVGLGIAFSVAAIVQVAVLWALLHHRVGNLDEPRILRATLLMTAAGVLAGIVTQAAKYGYVLVATHFGFWTIASLETTAAVFFQVIIAGGLGMGVYVAVGVWMRNEDMLGFARSVRRKLFRQVRPVETIAPISS